MPDLLLELFSEEIPARMQAQAAKDLERLVVGALSDRGLLFEGVKGFAGPRRLTLAIEGLPAKQPDVSEEKKGPRVGAPEKAIEGFLRSAGVSLDQCEKRDDGKGEFYVAVISRKGRATAEVLAEFLPEAFAKLPWPKSMRFPAGGTQRWVRPLHSILCAFDGETVPFEFAGIKSGNITLGHRFLSSGVIEARHFEDYEKKLRDGHVIVDAAERKEIILHEAKQKAFALGLELIEDEGLLEEVAGLAEWPVVLIGTIEDQFMDVPGEILQTSMRTHQKYFSLRDPRTGKLANRFALVSNMVASDGGKEIVAGNERVLRARLSDAKFFWDQDRKTKLADRVDALKNIVFHAKLGTQYERVERIELLVENFTSAQNDSFKSFAIRAARLCKADLTTGVVGEFPELQGIMGRYYALHDGEAAEVADAVRDHYLPLGQSYDIPKSRISGAVALADKLDMLVALYLAGERSSGSKDPFALRRTAIGIGRIIVGQGIRIHLRQAITYWAAHILGRLSDTRDVQAFAILEDVLRPYAFASERVVPNDLIVHQINAGAKRIREQSAKDAITVGEEVFQFIVGRMRAGYREIGFRHDIVDAILLLNDDDDLDQLRLRIEALGEFVGTKIGSSLLIGYKRAANILQAEEKKDKKQYREIPNPQYLDEKEDGPLFGVLLALQPELFEAIEKERFGDALTLLAKLREPIDAYFEHVTINVSDVERRKNRLRLLAHIVLAMRRVADFSKIEG